jgi:hypothetical protein
MPLEKIKTNTILISEEFLQLLFSPETECTI